jgi:hypothetical protein
MRVLVLVLMPILFGNASVTRRVWRIRRSAMSQKITRTLLIWLLPGSFLVISFRLRDSPPVSSVAPIDDGIDPQVSAWLEAGGPHNPPGSF